MNNEEYTFILYCFSTVSQLNKEGINPSVVIVITTHGHFLTVQWSGQLLSKLSQYNIKVNSWKFSLRIATKGNHHDQSLGKLPNYGNVPHSLFLAAVFIE